MRKPRQIVAFGADRCEPGHISLFRREQGPEDLRAHLLEQDLIYLGDGSVPAAGPLPEAMSTALAAP